MRKSLLKALIVLAFLGMALCSCKNKMEDIEAITFVDTFPQETVKNVEIIYSDSAKVKAILKAPLYKRYVGKNPYIEMPKGVNVIFYDSIMRVKTHLTAKYAIKYDKKNVMEAKNDVVVVNEKGEKLNTEKLIWDENRRKIYTDVFVKITTNDKIIYGEGMDADDSFLKWKIQKVSGTFYISTDDTQAEKK